MPLARLTGGVVRKFGGRVVRAAGKRLLKGGRFGRRRGRIPSLSASEMGKLLFMSQILGKKSPAVTLMVMKALGGRL